MFDPASILVYVQVGEALVQLAKDTIAGLKDKYGDTGDPEVFAKLEALYDQRIAQAKREAGQDVPSEG